MSKIDELINKYENLSTGDDKEDVFIKVKLKMIRGLFEDIKGSEDRIYVEEIISKFAEIMDRQQEIIGGLLTEMAAEAGYRSLQHNWAAHPNAITADDIPWDPESKSFAQKEPAVPPYMPPEGGFQSDEQVKKAFTNYLTYHVNRKTKAGIDKPFSVHTIYDYSSRIKVLMEIVYEEWKTINKDSWIKLDEQKLQVGCPFLNAYNNISALKQYVARKEQELRDISMGLREPAPEGQKNPLNNPRNLNNTSAALVRFEAFKSSITKQEM